MEDQKERTRRIAREHGISEDIADEVSSKFKKIVPLDNTQLLSIIQRVEKLLQDKADIMADVKEVLLEAKSAGFDPKYIKEMIKLRGLDPDELDETDELTKMYRNALGI